MVASRPKQSFAQRLKSAARDITRSLWIVGLSCLTGLSLLPEADPLRRRFHVHSRQSSFQFLCGYSRQHLLSCHLSESLEILCSPQFDCLSTSSLLRFSQDCFL